MKKIRILALVLAVLMISGCGGKKLEIVEESQQKSVIVVTKAMNSLHWLSVQEGAEDAGRDCGLRIQVLWPENESDAEAQNRIIEDCIQSDCDGVIWSPCNSNKVQRYTSNIISKKKKLMFMDEEPGYMKSAPFIGVDNMRAGQLAAESLTEVLRPGDTVAVIGGSLSQRAHYNRIRGFRTYIEEHTDANVVEIKEIPDATLAGGKSAMRELLAVYPDIRAVFCTSAMMVLGAQEACADKNRPDVKLVGMDTQWDAMSVLAEGKLHAMVSQNAYMIGYMAVVKMADMLNDADVSPRFYIDTELVTKERADEFMNEYVMEGRQ